MLAPIQYLYRLVKVREIIQGWARNKTQNSYLTDFTSQNQKKVYLRSKKFVKLQVSKKYLARKIPMANMNKDKGKTQDLAPWHSEQGFQ